MPPHRARTQPPVKPSKSAAVRHALLHPSLRQRSKMQRQRMQLRLIWGTAVALAVAIVAVLGFGYYRENIARGYEVAATVYGTPITLNDLVPWVTPRVKGGAEAISQLKAQGQDVSQFTLQLSRTPDRVLNDRIEAMVIQREADKRGITVTDQEVDAKIRQTIAEEAAAEAPQPTATPTTAGQATPAETAGAAAAATPAETSAANATPTATTTPAGTPTATETPTPVPTLTADLFKVKYEAFLDRTGYTNEQYRELTRQDLLRDKVKQAIEAQVPAVQEQIHARQIQVANKDQAQDILNKLDQGQSFEELAKAQSTDSESKDKGGDLGWLPRGIMPKEWDDAAFALQPGQRSGAVEVPGRGTVIIEVLERDPARPVADDQLTRLRQDAFDTWLTNAKKEPDVIQTPLTSEQRAYILRKAGVPNLA